MRMEHWWFTAPLRLKSILRGGRLERELDEELQFHLDHKIEEGIASGLSPRQARDAAMQRRIIRPSVDRKTPPHLSPCLPRGSFPRIPI